MIRERNDSEGGITLFLVLWVMVLLSVIAGEFCFAMRMEVKMTQNFKETTQAYFYARTGINAAIYELLKQEQIPDSEKQKEIQKEETGKTYWKLNDSVETMSFDDASVEIRIENESGKVNINRAGDSLLRLLFQTFNMKKEEIDIVVDSILDWRDKDVFHRIHGAEDEYYKKLKEPYECKDDEFDSIYELLNVRGITPQIFFGGLKDMVTVWEDDASDKTVTRSAIQQYLKLENRRSNSIQEYLTLEKRNRLMTNDSFDYNQIDVNAAPPRLLLSLPGMSENEVENVITYRKKNEFKSVAKMLSLVGNNIYIQIHPFIAVQKSKIFSITATGQMKNSGISKIVKVKVQVDNKLKEKYRILEWMDSLYEGANLSQENESQYGLRENNA